MDIEKLLRRNMRKRGGAFFDQGELREGVDIEEELIIQKVRQKAERVFYQRLFEMLPEVKVKGCDKE